jgi:hypothetical protein
MPGVKASISASAANSAARPTASPMAHQRVHGEHASAFGEHKQGVDLQFEQPAGGPVLLVDPYIAEEGVRAVAEDQQEARLAQVAVVVDPLAAHRCAVQPQRCGRGHGRIPGRVPAALVRGDDAVAHAAAPLAMAGRAR